MRKISLILSAGVLLALSGPADACWNGSGQCVRNNGVFSGSTTWQDTTASGRKHRADDLDTHDNGLATGIQASVNRNGENAAAADLPMGGFKHTGVGNATARNHYAAVGQIQDSSYTFVPAASVGGSANSITLSPSPAITAYAAGQTFQFVAEAANTDAAVINVSSVGEKAITKTGATALTAGDIANGALIQVVYDGTQFQLISTSGVDVGSGILTGDNTFTGTNTFSGTAAVTGSLTFGGGTVIPIGTIQMYAGASEPTGWHFADGEAISRSTYAACFSAMGTTFGTGNGSTTFNLPNIKGRVPIGVGQGSTAEGGGTGTNRTLAATGGKEAHTLTSSESGLPAHNHPATLLGGGGANASTGAGTPSMGATTSNGQISGTNIVVNNNSASNASSAHTIMNPFLALNFIVFCPN